MKKKQSGNFEHNGKSYYVSVDSNVILVSFREYSDASGETYSHTATFSLDGTLGQSFCQASMRVDDDYHNLEGSSYSFDCSNHEEYWEVYKEFERQMQGADTFSMDAIPS